MFRIAEQSVSRASPYRCCKIKGLTGPCFLPSRCVTGCKSLCNQSAAVSLIRTEPEFFRIVVPLAFRPISFLILWYVGGSSTVCNKFVPHARERASSALFYPTDCILLRHWSHFVCNSSSLPRSKADFHDKIHYYTGAPTMYCSDSTMPDLFAPANLYLGNHFLFHFVTPMKKNLKVQWNGDDALCLPTTHLIEAVPPDANSVKTLTTPSTIAWCCSHLGLITERARRFTLSLLSPFEGRESCKVGFLAADHFYVGNPLGASSQGCYRRWFSLAKIPLGSNFLFSIHVHSNFGTKLAKKVQYIAGVVWDRIQKLTGMGHAVAYSNPHLRKAHHNEEVALLEVFEGFKNPQCCLFPQEGLPMTLSREKYMSDTINYASNVIEDRKRCIGIVPQRKLSVTCSLHYWYDAPSLLVPKGAIPESLRLTPAPTSFMKASFRGYLSKPLFSALHRVSHQRMNKSTSNTSKLSSRNLTSKSGLSRARKMTGHAHTQSRRSKQMTTPRKALAKLENPKSTSSTLRRENKKKDTLKHPRPAGSKAGKDTSSVRASSQRPRPTTANAAAMRPRRFGSPTRRPASGGGGRGPTRAAGKGRRGGRKGRPDRGQSDGRGPRRVSLAPLPRRALARVRPHPSKGGRPPTGTPARRGGRRGGRGPVLAVPPTVDRTCATKKTVSDAVQLIAAFPNGVAPALLARMPLHDLAAGAAVHRRVPLRDLLAPFFLRSLLSGDGMESEKNPSRWSKRKALLELDRLLPKFGALVVVSERVCRAGLKRPVSPSYAVDSTIAAVVAALKLEGISLEALAASGVPLVLLLIRDSFLTRHACEEQRAAIEEEIQRREAFKRTRVFVFPRFSESPQYPAMR